MSNIIVVIGGAGFIGSNLIQKLLIDTEFKIISIDNYFTGSKKNHIKNNRIKYLKADTKNIFRVLNIYKKKILIIFHFGEFSRVAQSFKLRKELLNSNIVGTSQVIEFCNINKIKIIYSATSAAFGNNFEDQNLSPYSFSKNINLNLIINYSIWFNLKYEILYFYNVYGPRQILKEKMGAVIGIFENCKKTNKPLPVVKPGTQKRIFTHVDDIVKACLFAMKENKNRHYIIRAKESYSILDVAKMFNQKYILVNERLGERFVPTLPNKIRGNKIFKIVGKKKLKDYIKEKYES